MAALRILSLSVRAASALRVGRCVPFGEGVIRMPAAKSAGFGTGPPFARFDGSTRRAPSGPLPHPEQRRGTS